MGKDSRKIYVSSDVVFNEKSTSNAEQLTDHVYRYRIDFGLPEECEDQATDDEAENQQDSVDEQINNPVQPEGRQLRSRQLLNPIDRYGIPVALLAESVPMTFQEATSSPGAKRWKGAVQEEMNASQENNTWRVMPLPKGKRAIGCKWVFAIKKNSHDNSDRYKARLVAKVSLSEKESTILKLLHLWSAMNL